MSFMPFMLFMSLMSFMSFMHIIHVVASGVCVCVYASLLEAALRSCASLAAAPAARHCVPKSPFEMVG